MPAGRLAGELGGRIIQRGQNLSMVLWIIGLESKVILTDTKITAENPKENHHLPKCSAQAHRLVRVQIDEPPRSQNRCGKQNVELPLLCHFTVLYVRGSISRLPACPDLMP